MIIPLSPVAEYKLLKSEIDKAIAKVMLRGKYILDSEVSSFEQEFAKYIGVKYAVGVASGTDALYFSLRALGISKGDEVITVSHTAVATVAAIVQTGAIPVFVDIKSDTLLMDETLIEKKISRKTKAIIGVHLYGNTININAVLDICKKHKLLFIEDCAQATGTEYYDKKVGGFGICSAFSFYPTKNLSCYGDGGIILTNNGQIYNQIKELREYGWKERYISFEHGWNSRLDEIQAAILRVKLNHLNDLLNIRRRIAGNYLKEIKNPKITLPMISKEINHSFHLFVIQCKRRDYLKKYLFDKGILTLIHYPQPVHLQPAYKMFDKAKNLIITEQVKNKILSLPIHVGINKNSLKKILIALNSF
jgi:dTDP-4-amino-4,6-dideoxygalactose transaminase